MNDKQHQEYNPFQFFFHIQAKFLHLHIWRKVVVIGGLIYLLALLFLPALSEGEFSVNYAFGSSNSSVSLWFILGLIMAYKAIHMPFVRFKIPFGETTSYFILGALMALMPILRSIADDNYDGLFSAYGLGIWLMILSGGLISFGSGFLGGGFAPIKEAFSSLSQQAKEEAKAEEEEAKSWEKDEDSSSKKNKN